MNNAQASNPNDIKVVSFHNTEDFRFTPDMGCMYDGRPINGTTGTPGIEAGETLQLPYHVGKLLAKNLAKRVLNTSPASVDVKGVPTGKPIWSAEELNLKADSYIKELYMEAKPIAMSETDKLMAKVEEYKKLVEDKLGTLDKGVEKPVESTKEVAQPETPKVFQDKAEVLAELEKRGIKHDKRSNKVTLEKLLT